MSKMTFVVEYPDGEEPAISKGMDRSGGKLIYASFGDLAKVNSVLEELILKMKQELEKTN